MQFSVIVPAKNEQDNIAACLDSIMRVDWDPHEYEVLVVDNGSTDATATIARQMGATVFQQPALNLSGLRNYAALHARGELLAFMDADCTVDRFWLREAAKYLRREEVVCFGSPPVVPPGATWVQRAWFQVRKKEVEVGETSWLESMNMFVRRATFLACGGFDEELTTCEDYDLSLRLAKVGKLLTDSSIVAIHHGEAASVGHFFKKERWRGIGNLRGMARHGLTRAELPSLCLPLWHCAVLAAPAAGLALSGAGHAQAAFVATGLFLAWQLLLFSLCLARYYGGSFAAVAQIYLLLNVYYLARGVASLRNG